MTRARTTPASMRCAATSCCPRGGVGGGGGGGGGGRGGAPTTRRRGGGATPTCRGGGRPCPDRDYPARARKKYKRLEPLSHRPQALAWDGRKVLSDLIAKEGGIRIPREKRQHIARIFSVILWGELAAWNVAADLALALEDVEA